MSAIYLVPLIPFLTHGVLLARHHGQMNQVVDEEEMDRDSHRTQILTFAGFSFSGVIALIVLEPAVRQSLHQAVFFLLVSFLSYLWALNLQGYKATRWQCEAATAIADAGSLCLVMALVSLLVTSALGAKFVVGSAILALGVWTGDHLIRLCLDWRHLSACERRSIEGEVVVGQKG